MESYPDAWPACFYKQLDRNRRAQINAWLSQTEGARIVQSEFSALVQQGKEEQIWGQQVINVLDEWIKHFPPEIEAITSGLAKRWASQTQLSNLLREGDLPTLLLHAWFEPDAVDDDRELARELARNFRQPYCGKAVDCLEDTLVSYDGCYNGDLHHGKVLSIIQSSGSGKTRMAHELSKKRPTVVVHLRGLGSSDPAYGQRSVNGWPHGDAPIRDFFMQGWQSEELVGAFIGALFTVMIRTALHSPDLATFNLYWEPSSNYNASDCWRYTIMQVVRLEARNLIKKHAQRFSEFRPTSKEPNAMLEWARKIYDLLIKPQAKMLQSAFQRISPATFVVIGFDPATDFNLDLERQKEFYPTSRTKNLVALRRILKACDDLNVWFLLIDTSLNPLECHPDLDRNGRLAPPPNPLRPCQMTEWDAMINLVPLAQTPEEAYSWSHLRHYGRPLWHELADGEALMVARAKLIFSRSFSPNNVDEVLAVLSARICLLLSRGEEPTELAMKSVARHMRTFTHLQRGEHPMTLAASEPILAIAATTLLLDDESAYHRAIHTLVNRIILEGCLDEEGLHGMVTGRILLMIARDAASLKNPKGRSLRHSTTGYPVESFREFLVSLLGNELGLVKDATGEQTRLKDDILNWAADYHINFTHFLPHDEDMYEIPDIFLWMCWCRGVALLRPHGASTFDILIVVYKGELSEPFEFSAFGFVPIRITLDGVSHPWDIERLTCPVVVLDEINASPKGTAEDDTARSEAAGDATAESGTVQDETIKDQGSHYKPEHLAIVMDLGADSDAYFKDTESWCRFSKAKARHSLFDCREDQIPPGYLVNEPERHVIEVRGVQNGQYPAVKTLAPALHDLDLFTPKDPRQQRNHRQFIASLNPLSKPTTALYDHIHGRSQ